jgi:hypothetical protein
MNGDIAQKLEEFYDFNIPGYVRGAGKSYLKVYIDDILCGEREVKIKVGDVAEYYATQARNMSSGCRTLAGVTGDWRPIDNLASECLEWFKTVNVETLRKEARKLGIEPRF